MSRVLVWCPDGGVPWWGPAGSSAHLRGMAQAFARAGHDVTVAVDRVGHGPDLGLEWITLPHAPRATGRRAREAERRDRAKALLAKATARAPDLIWARHAAAGDALACWRRRHDVPVWLEVNAPVVLERDLTDPIGDRRRADRDERLQIASADRVFVVSRWLRTWALALGARDVRWLPHGTDHTRLGDREGARARLGLAGLVIGYVGACRPWHRLDRLGPLLDALPEATALVIGDGPAPPAPHPRLRRLPAQADPSDAIAAMDVGLALGGFPWMQPLKAYDYAAQGLPLVAPAALGLPLPHAPVHATEAPADWARAVRWAARQPRAPRPRRWDDVVRELGELPGATA